MVKYSVVITTYKRNESIVRRAVDSVLQQTNQEFEILLVDNNEVNSPYSSALKIEFQKDEKVSYLRQEGNKGACAARNLGINHAKGEFVAFLDDDDTWEPQKMELQLRKFEDGVGLVFCLGYTINENFTPPRKDKYYTAGLYQEEITFPELLCEDRIGSTSQAVVRKECFSVCGGFDESLPARQDYEMWLRISKKYRVVGVKELLFTHYYHCGEQITKDSQKALKGFLLVYKKYAADYKQYQNGKKVMLEWILNAAQRAHSHWWLYYRIQLKVVTLQMRLSGDSI